MQHLIDGIRKSLESQNWYAALTLSLTLPDICSKYSAPSKDRYAAWFEKYVGSKYVGFLSGKDCYALRCAFLHEGTGLIDGQRAKDVLDGFVFIGSKERSVHCVQMNFILQLDVATFCEDICSGVEQWVNETNPLLFKHRVLNILAPQDGDRVTFDAFGMRVVQRNGIERWGMAHEAKGKTEESKEGQEGVSKLCKNLQEVMVMHGVGLIKPFVAQAFIGEASNGEFLIDGMRLTRLSVSHRQEAIEALGFDKEESERLLGLDEDSRMENLRTSIKRVFDDLSIARVIPRSHDSYIGWDLDSGSDLFMLQGIFSVLK